MHSTIFEVARSTFSDLLIFNEFVDGPSREDFKRLLRAEGFEHQYATPSEGRQNQIFLASKNEFRLVCTVNRNPITPIASNQCVFVCSEIKIYALRVPAYKKVSEKRIAWEYYLSEIASLDPHVIVGDFNVDPVAHEQTFLERIVELGYVHHAIDGASFWTNNGKPRKLDHLFSRGLTISSATYLAEHRGQPLVGKTRAFASDHCPIIFDLVKI